MREMNTRVGGLGVRLYESGRLKVISESKLVCRENIFVGKKKCC